MSNAPRGDESHKEWLERLVRERVYEEFPKSLYHPDGRSIVVNSRREQDASGGDWLESPQEAIDEKTKRDKRDSEKFIAAANAEAKAKKG